MSLRIKQILFIVAAIFLTALILAGLAIVAVVSGVLVGVILLINWVKQWGTKTSPVNKETDDVVIEGDYEVIEESEEGKN